LGHFLQKTFSITSLPLALGILKERNLFKVVEEKTN